MRSSTGRSPGLTCKCCLFFSFPVGHRQPASVNETISNFCSFYPPSIVSAIHKDVNNMEVETQTNTCMEVNDVD